MFRATVCFAFLILLAIPPGRVLRLAESTTHTATKLPKNKATTVATTSADSDPDSRELLRLLSSLKSARGSMYVGNMAYYESISKEIPTPPPRACATPLSA